MKIAEAAARIGVAPHVLRHWEDVGVLTPPRTASGYRDYDAQSVALGRAVLLCQAAGLSLAEVRALGESDDATRRLLVVRRREAIAEARAVLDRADAYLDHVLQCRHPVVADCPQCRAHLAERDTPAPRTVAPVEPPPR